MNIDDFYKRFGRDTTTIFQLDKYAKELKIPNFYVCMHDEINQLPRNKFPLKVIVNIHMSKEQGVHWSALYINKCITIFFDSYGLVPTQEIVDFSQHSQRMRNTLEVQSFSESNCRQLSLYMLYKLNKEEPFQDIITVYFGV